MDKLVKLGAKVELPGGQLPDSAAVRAHAGGWPGHPRPPRLFPPSWRCRPRGPPGCRAVRPDQPAATRTSWRSSWIWAPTCSSPNGAAQAEPVPAEGCDRTGPVRRPRGPGHGARSPARTAVPTAPSPPSGGGRGVVHGGRRRTASSSRSTHPVGRGRPAPSATSTGFSCGVSRQRPRRQSPASQLGTSALSWTPGPVVRCSGWWRPGRSPPVRSRAPPPRPRPSVGDRRPSGRTARDLAVRRHRRPAPCPWIGSRRPNSSTTPPARTRAGQPVHGADELRDERCRRALVQLRGRGALF